MCARARVSRCAVRACPPQHLELSAPRRRGTKTVCPNQTTSRIQMLQRAQAPELLGSPRVHLTYLAPCRLHCVAHRAIHHQETREVNGIREVVRTEDQSQNDLGKAGNRCVRLGRLRFGHERCARSAWRARGSASGYITRHVAPGVVAGARRERGREAIRNAVVSSDVTSFGC